MLHFFRVFTRYACYIELFFSNSKVSKSSVIRFHKGDIQSTIVLTMLGVLSVVSGYLTERFFRQGFLLFNNNFLKDSVDYHLIEQEFVPFYIKIIPIGLLIAALFLYFVGIKVTDRDYAINWGKLQKFFMAKGYFDVIYNQYLTVGMWNFSMFLYRNTDKGFLELFGPSSLNYTYRYAIYNILLQRQATPFYLFFGYLVVICAFACEEVWLVVASLV